EDAWVGLGARDPERGRAARDALVSDHPDWAERVEVVVIDVTDDASVHAAAEHVAARHSELYGVVNNAGIGLGSADLDGVLQVNTYGPKRVCDAFLPLTRERIVNVSSASGPMFLAGCSRARQVQLTASDVTWADVERFIADARAVAGGDGDFAAAGMGGGNAYGLSKACLNAYTIALAREHEGLCINACTPGYIATDLTLPRARDRGADPSAMGMKSPAEGTRATMHLLFGTPGGSGWYFGSDAQRSPLDRYRAPGDPPYRGDEAT
ncbi:MAG: SDR family NAD(P)-dependent oxidoreductase, partial [Myxococcota bacterium]